MRTERPEHAEESAGLAKLAPDREKMTGESIVDPIVVAWPANHGGRIVSTWIDRLCEPLKMNCELPGNRLRCQSL